MFTYIYIYIYIHIILRSDYVTTTLTMTSQDDFTTDYVIRCLRNSSAAGDMEPVDIIVLR